MSDILDVSLANLSDCGCCEGITIETPVTIENRPGLSAIAYRVGTHAQFKDSMLARLSLLAQEYPVLTQLKTRDDNDFSIALLDAWATVADVLTFYQERIANESYLRTTTERLSLLQLARLIGYKLRPGVAASAYLAFTLEDARGAPGYATIDSGTKVQSIPGPGELPQTFETVEKIEARAEWNTLDPQRTAKALPDHGDIAIDLKGVSTGLKEGDTLLLVGNRDINSQQWDFRLVTKVEADTVNGRTHVTLDRGLGSLRIDPEAYAEAKVYAMRKRAALFGSNAPDTSTLPATVLQNYHISGTPPPDWNFTLSSPINLDTTYPNLTPSTTSSDSQPQDSWLVLSIPSPRFANKAYRKRYRITDVFESSPKLYTLTSKATTVTLEVPGPDYLDNFNKNYRAVTVFMQSEELELADLPLQTPITGSAIQLAQPVHGLAKGQHIIVSGKAPGAGKNDPLMSEVVSIESPSSDSLSITLQTGLQNQYDPATVTIYANVALATHGETVANEVLGNGDAGQPYQRFPLRQSPLTYVSAATPEGAASTLHVRVNDIEWHETPALYGHGARERIFVTGTGDAGKTTVEFGDGTTGARLPTGQQNVKATYRKGIGLAGNVKAEQLSLLMTRPLGVKSVINPHDASGGADPESLDGARKNAPLTVLTLGRVVSLEDYEDFARAFPGIGKALATWTWSGQTRGVFLTVAGPGGATVSSASQTYQNLLSALQTYGDPFVPLRVQTYRPAYFRLAARVKVDPNYVVADVLAAVEKALRSAFSFDARAFGQPVAQSEIYAVMQAVPGVVAVDLYQFYRELPLYFLYRFYTFPWASSSNVLNAILPAAVPQVGTDGNVQPAELLTLDTAPLDNLGVML